MNWCMSVVLPSLILSITQNHFQKQLTVSLCGLNTERKAFYGEDHKYVIQLISLEH